MSALICTTRIVSVPILFKIIERQTLYPVIWGLALLLGGQKSNALTIPDVYLFYFFFHAHLLIVPNNMNEPNAIHAQLEFFLQANIFTFTDAITYCTEQKRL